MSNSWDDNARLRHAQMLSGKDISFDRVLSPAILELVEREARGRAISLLEAGCGTGILLRTLAAPGRIVTGVDSSAASVDLAIEFNRDNPNIEIILCPIEDFPSISQRSYDIVVSNMVFQTIPSLPNSVAALHSILQPRGCLIFSIPHPCFWLAYQSKRSSISYSYNEIAQYNLPFHITNENTALPQQVPYVHRPLSWYVALLVKHGFAIEQLLEPFPDASIMKLYSQPWDAPHFTIFQARKV